MSVMGWGIALVYCCALSLCCLGAETDDQYRNPNVNNKDHPVGQLTEIIIHIIKVMNQAIF